jgi:hypothetical protein
MMRRLDRRGASWRRGGAVDRTHAWQNAFGLLMSLNMLIETPAGFDYTGADCIRWLKGAASTTRT